MKIYFKKLEEFDFFFLNETKVDHNKKRKRKISNSNCFIRNI